MKSRFGILMAAISLVALSACGGAGGSGVGGDSLSGISLSDIPSASQMVGTSDSTTALARAVVTGDEYLPLVTDLDEDPDQYFWNGLIAEINDAGWVHSLQDEQDFWKGRGACSMVQGFGQAFQNIMQGATSSCYMSRLPFAESGVTIDGSTAEDVFSPVADEKVVNVNVINDEFGGEKIFIKVHGTNEVGNSTLKYTMWFCNSETNIVRGTEVIEINMDTGLYTTTNKEAGDDHQGTFSLTGYLTQSGGEVSWDISRPRSASVHYLFSHSGDWGESEGNFKSDIEIDGSTLITKMNETSEQSGDWGEATHENKRFLAATFSGGSLTDLRLRQVAAKEHVVTSGEWEGAHTSETAADWTASNENDGRYEPVEEGDLYDLLAEVVFEDDSFYDELGTPDYEVDAEDFPCEGVDVDVTVQMDFADPGVDDVREACENRWEQFDMCWQGDVSEAERKIFDNMTWN